MKVKYDKLKGYRIKKGTYKSTKTGKRFSIFMGLKIINKDYNFYSEKYHKWITFYELCNLKLL